MTSPQPRRSTQPQAASTPPPAASSSPQRRRNTTPPAASSPQRRSSTPPPAVSTQHNVAHGHAVVNANQGPGAMNVVQNFLSPTRRGGYGRWLLLALVLVDVAYFFYGMLAYSGGTDPAADAWRAWIFLFLVIWTLRTAVRLLRRNF